MIGPGLHAEVQLEGHIGLNHDESASCGRAPSRLMR